MAFQDTFEELAKDPDMTGENYKVLFYLYSKLDFENFIQQSQKEIGEGLGIRTEHISRAMKMLIQKQIVLEGPKVGRSKCYRLNPNYGWKGKVKTLQEHRREQFQVIQGGIGKENKNGTPVAREVRAMDDIASATGFRPSFVPYNRPF